LRAGRDRPGLEPDGLERPDDLSGLVERGDVPLSEQLGDERRVLVLALELEREDPVEFVLLDAREVGAGHPISQHLREVRRPTGGVGDVLGIRDVGAFDVSHLDHEFDPPAVEVAELQPEQVVVVEVRLVDLRAPVPD